MKTLKVKNWADFLKTIDGLPKEGRMYRGVRKVDHELIPKVGRKEYAGSYHRDSEKELLALFKERAIAHAQNPPDYDDNLGWLALAQHHGLPT